MKFKKPKLNRKKHSKKIFMEDMRYLQKKISGRSVYANVQAVYNRVPKHRNRGYTAEFNSLRGN